ncbi:MAG: hypothetical protein ACXVYU_12175 [Oryzihumus sp.]
MAQPWRDMGVEVSDALARARLEQRLAAVLADRGGGAPVSLLAGRRYAVWPPRA